MTTIFVHKLRARSQQDPGIIALPEGDDPRAQITARRLLEDGICRQVYLNSAKVQTLEPYFSKIHFTNCDPSHRLEAAADALYRGEVDAVVAGLVHPTAEVVRAGIQGVGLAPGLRTVSGSFFMDGPETLLFADCGVVPNPTTTQLVDIAASSVATWQSILPDEPPRLAFLSFSTKGSADTEETSKVKNAFEAFRARLPEVAADGELQFDAAWVDEVRQQKAPYSTLHDRANCFIFPNLDAGNIAYKMTQRLANFGAYGPILQGLAKPFSDLSRGATDDDVYYSAMINLLRRRNANP